MGFIKTFKDGCRDKELSGHLGGDWILDCAAGEVQGRGPSSTPDQQSPMERGSLKLGSWGSLAKQQQLHLGRSFAQHEMGMMPHEQAACTSLFLGGAVPEGIVKLLLLCDRNDLHNSLVAFHVVTRHLGL